MPQSGLIFRALVASPNDCIDERRIAVEVIAAWNAVNSESTAAIIEAVLWETHSRPAVGDRPQGIINRQLVDRCDLVVGAFWTRLGTPTGEAESGTAEEIEQFRTAKKPVLIYFSTVPISPTNLDLEQLSALNAYREKLKSDSLYETYESTAEFRQKLQGQLGAEMISQLKLHAPDAAKRAAEVDESQVHLESAKQFVSTYKAFLRKLKAEWSAERDSDPMNIEDGKYIMSSAAGEISHFLSQVVEDETNSSAMLQNALVDMKKIQHHRLYGDGGKSYRDFWTAGDAIVEQLESAIGPIEAFAHPSSEPTARKFKERDPKELEILQLLDPIRGTKTKVIAERIEKSLKSTLFHLLELDNAGMVNSTNYSRDPIWNTGVAVEDSTWTIRQDGMALLKANGTLD
jgi:hypothetical protein